MDEKGVSRYFNEILDQIPEGLMVVDPKGNILFVNEAMAQLTGYGAGELAGSPCTILNCDVCEVIRSQAKKHFCNLFEIKKVKGKRCLFMKKNGTYASVKKDASVLRDSEGHLLGALEIYHDISELDKKDRQIEALSRKANEEAGFYGMVGKSTVMKKVFQIVEKVAQSDAPVLITGESGTGKELVAQAIHRMGTRREGPMVQFNCAALNPSLLESELFGHVKGAFTGAYRHRKGRFEAAQGGDIFLDEIGDLPLSLQAKLLRVLEMKQIERVGDHAPINVDVRIITATNRDLLGLIQQGKFREDLYFRINVVPVHLPPLRERVDDIPLLVDAFLRRLRKRSHKEIPGIDPEVMDFFMRYRWPGNIRELKSTLEYAFVVAESGVIQMNHLPKTSNRSDDVPTAVSMPMNPKEEEEKASLLKALEQSRGNKTEAARILKVHRMTVWNRMRKYGIHMKQHVADHERD
ncbi:MAG: sigma 54-interacting transcriptional regulator [Deltaproteobacteria bacterium]|nr:sigma 54-interacting transcriptional regulator [Deltaproteobacteria bacterium]